MDEPADPRELGRVLPAKPCRAGRGERRGEGCVQTCPRCQQRVYDVSAVTALEARELILANEGQLRVRFYQRADGALLTRDCAVGVAAAQHRAVAASLLAVAALAAAVVAAAFTLDDAVRGPDAPVPLSRAALAQK